MENKSKNFILQENNYDFHYKKQKSDIDIRFNRVAFIFFVFYYICNLLNSFTSFRFKKY